ncbi:C-C motif chemokine 2-like [Myripristis murdjan]|uniref:C-C motif chemokine 2-like n=1 Tax=Myripristis murdjan TaxID=586833 RepID=UPI00117638EA|nr:C-C motif chemokine 2-like [Myripristis murdjan]
MWTSLSSSRGISLLTVTIVICMSASEVYSQNQRTPKCCPAVSRKRITERIAECYIQKPEFPCRINAYLFVTISGKEWCVDPDASWLKNRLNQVRRRRIQPLTCDPLFTLD